MQIYLDFKSNHPTHCKVGLIYGQALRIIERCSDPLDADLHLENLRGKLLDRDYPEIMIKTSSKGQKDQIEISWYTKIERRKMMTKSGVFSHLMEATHPSTYGSDKPKDVY